MKRTRPLFDLPTEGRICPCCASSHTLAVFNGTESRGGQKVDIAGCGCLDCDASWQERFYRRECRTEQFDVRPKGSAAASQAQTAQAMPRRCPACDSLHTLATAKGSVIRSGQLVSEADCRCQKCEATWLERWYHEDKKARLFNLRWPLNNPPGRKLSPMGE